MTKSQKKPKTDTSAALSIILLASMTLFLVVLFIITG